MRLESEAIVCAVRSHGEHGGVVRLMTELHGLQAAYVRGARGRRLGPVLIVGNVVHARLRSRTETQLPQGEIELTHSRALLMQEALPAAAVEWATAMTAALLPEGHPYPAINLALDALLSAIEAAPAASGWGAALVRYELLLLSELGFGLDLDSCAVSGDTDCLVAVSPRSGRAVSERCSQPFAGKLLALPPFLRSGGQGRWDEIADGLALTGHFLERDLLAGRPAALVAARSRLVERLRRAGGLA